MHTTILAAAAGNPVSNWMTQWKQGWDHPAASLGGQGHADVISVAIVLALILLLVMGARRAFS